MTKISNEVSVIESVEYHTMADQQRFLDWIDNYISSLTNRKFYGKFTLSFESGKVTTCKLEETLKPDF